MTTREITARWYNRSPNPPPGWPLDLRGADAVIDSPALPVVVNPGGVSEEEYARVRRRLAASVARVCPSWLADRADDIVQVAFTRVMAAIVARGPGDPVPATYLWKASYSATIDEIRRLRRERGVSLDTVAADEIADWRGSNPEQQRWGHEIGAAIRDCLRRLAHPRRLAVTLHLIGHSLAESSRLLGWDAKRVDNLVYRGLADLRGCLGAKGLAP